MDGMGGAAPTPPGWYNDGTGVLRYWDGRAWTAHVAPPVPPPPPSYAFGRAPAQSALVGQPGAFWCVAVCAGVVIIGGFGPWVTALNAIDVSGTRGDGWIAIAVGALTLVALFPTARSRGSGAGLIAVIAGLIGAAIGGVD